MYFNHVNNKLLIGQNFNLIETVIKELLFNNSIYYRKKSWF